MQLSSWCTLYLLAQIGLKFLNARLTLLTFFASVSVQMPSTCRYQQWLTTSNTPQPALCQATQEWKLPTPNHHAPGEELVPISFAAYNFTLKLNSKWPSTSFHHPAKAINDDARNIHLHHLAPFYTILQRPAPYLHPLDDFLDMSLQLWVQHELVMEYARKFPACKWKPYSWQHNQPRNPRRCQPWIQIF